MVAWSAIGSALKTVGGSAVKLAKSAGTKIANWASSDAGKNILGGIAGNLGSIGGLFNKGDSSAKAIAEQYKYNLALQKQAQDWNEYMYRNRFQMQREDLENAGINPLFGMGQAPSVTSGTNSVGMADYVGEQANKFQQVMQALDFGQNLSAKRAQTKLIQAQATTAQINTLTEALKVKEKQLQIAHSQKDLDWKDKLYITQIKKDIAQINNIISDTLGKDLDNKPKERREEAIKNSKVLQFMSDNRDSILPLAGLLFGSGFLINGAKLFNTARQVGFRIK